MKDGKLVCGHPPKVDSLIEDDRFGQSLAIPCWKAAQSVTTLEKKAWGEGRGIGARKEGSGSTREGLCYDEESKPKLLPMLRQSFLVLRSSWIMSH